MGTDEAVLEQKQKVVELPNIITVRELATLIGVSPIDVIKELMSNGIMASINQQIDYETAAIVVAEFGYEPVSLAELAAKAKAEEEAAPGPLWERFYAQEDPAKLRPRPPVVTMLGHVDHGKTSLLDAIRGTNVFASEAGGITQHMGAYQVKHKDRLITFLDTPGHEAFTAMRARGAQGADIAILVVAADDGVMPQTKEALAHARAARVPVIVALNKIDLPSANPERVKQELADLGLVPDEWGGDTLIIQTSAKEKVGLEDLLEAILLVADSMETIVANPDRPAQGTVIEGGLERSRGVVATLLVQNGTLRVGDVVLAGTAYGRVRAMFDFRGKRIKAAPPSTPVSILGLSEVPVAGTIFEVVANEKLARAMAEERKEAETQVETRPALSLEDIYAQFRAGEVKRLNLIVKADVQGTLEPIINSLRKLESEELKLEIIHAAPGEITESDVMLAAASQAIIIGFQVGVDTAARKMADSEGVDIRTYDIIYKLIEDVEMALYGLLEPTYVDVVIGEAEVRATFRIPRVGVVAGCYVRAGVIRRNARARVVRNQEVIADTEVASLKRYQEDVREVRTGFECGVRLAGFEDFQEGDIIEFYEKRREGEPV